MRLGSENLGAENGKSLFKDTRAVDECLLETWCCLHWPAHSVGLTGDLTISKVGRGLPPVLQ